ncbi:phage tail tube protein [Aeromonas hydrophila]|uniref:phage tail tube protein n=1 Tax=Aeromonas hydrophila TaxID=644 RepID=UPI003D246AFE
MAITNLKDISVSNYSKFEIKNASAWVVVGEVTDMSGFTGESTIVDVMQYGKRFARRLVGSATAGPINVSAAWKPTDAGQMAMEKSFKDATPQNFRVTFYADATQTKGISSEFAGYVSSFSLENAFDSARTMTCAVAVDGALGDWADATV